MSYRRAIIFDPLSKESHKVSRSKIELFLDCHRCFYLGECHGIKRPEFPAFTLNSAVDHLLKKEFDIHRARGEAHPLMKKYGINAVPFEHKDLDSWRKNFEGVQYLHVPTNLLITGAIDDLWINTKGVLHVVDYKATAKNEDPNLDGPWQQAYKRQMEVYQWLLRQNKFNVSSLGYFVYVNGKKDRKAFDAKLEFDMHIISYEGDDSWIPDTIVKLKSCLMGNLPKENESCEYCDYRKKAALIAAKLEAKRVDTKKKDRVLTQSVSSTLF